MFKNTFTIAVQSMFAVYQNGQKIDAKVMEQRIQGLHYDKAVQPSSRSFRHSVTVALFSTALAENIARVLGERLLPKTRFFSFTKLFIPILHMNIDVGNPCDLFDTGQGDNSIIEVPSITGDSDASGRKRQSASFAFTKK